MCDELFPIMHATHLSRSHSLVSPIISTMACLRCRLHNVTAQSGPQGRQKCSIKHGNTGSVVRNSTWLMRPTNLAQIMSQYHKIHFNHEQIFTNNQINKLDHAELELTVGTGPGTCMDGARPGTRHSDSAESRLCIDQSQHHHASHAQHNIITHHMHNTTSSSPITCTAQHHHPSHARHNIITHHMHSTADGLFRKSGSN